VLKEGVAPKSTDGWAAEVLRTLVGGVAVGYVPMLSAVVGAIDSKIGLVCEMEMEMEILMWWYDGVVWNES
jgi:hypothetical protein